MPSSHSASSAPFHLAYTPKYSRRTICCSTLPCHSFAFMVVQVWMRPNEFYHGQLDMGGTCSIPAIICASRQIRNMLQRIAAVRKTAPRCKVSVIAEATGRMQAAVRTTMLQPYEYHFHPRPGGFTVKKPESRRIGHPLAAINILPYSDQVWYHISFSSLHV